MDLKTNRVVQFPADGAYVIAVSGGVDSVVLLDLFSRAHSRTYTIVVAHFDHGIREDSSQDTLFVAELAKRYHFAFESKREELGTGASEELARDRRYEYLRSIATRHSAGLVTAHHANDCVESIAINLTRGTGWRGLAVLDSDIIRPLLRMTKPEILEYAASRRLIWREDSTNMSDAYLRNRIRRKTNKLSDDSQRQLLGLRAHQVWLKQQIDDEVRTCIGNDSTYSRYFFTHLDSDTAAECLRQVTAAQLTRPQLAQALMAIKTSRPGTRYQAGNGILFSFTSRNFTVELIK